MSVIELKDLKVCYGSFQALKGVTVDIAGGGVGLLGPNGAGKSTLIRALLGLVDVASGRGRVLGLDIGQDGLSIRRAVGYMPERDSHVPGMTGFEFVAYSGWLVGMPRADARQRAHEVLQYVGLGEARYREVDQYSRGMKQKVKLAQALVHDPRLVFLDEPTNGLDPHARVEILELIRHLWHEKGMHVILSSHLLQDVESVCDSVVVLAQGEVRSAGTIAALKSHQGRAYQVRIKGDAAAFASRLAELGLQAQLGEAGDLTVDLGGERGTRAILVAARDAHVQVRRLLPVEESLEDVFLRSLEGAAAGASPAGAVASAAQR
ncbi:MAG: ABC transporter ATP-binding protein [Planctomycetota bacterium]